MTATALPMRSPADLAIGQKIKDLRGARKISQTALGEALGISFQQIQKYERGANRVSCSALIEIARALGVDPGWFFDGVAAPADDATLAHEANIKGMQLHPEMRVIAERLVDLPPVTRARTVEALKAICLAVLTAAAGEQVVRLRDSAA